MEKDTNLEAEDLLVDSGLYALQSEYIDIELL